MSLWVFDIPKICLGRLPTLRVGVCNDYHEKEPLIFLPS